MTDSEDRTSSSDSDLGAELIRARIRPQAADALADLGDLALHRLTDALDEVPFLGTLKRALHGAGAVRDALLLKKILRFLRHRPPQEHKRAKFALALGDPGYRRDVGEQLLLFLDKVDEVAKSTMIAQIFNALLMDKIDYGQARTLWATVVNVPLTDLERLRLARAERLESDVEQVLSAAGLMTALESTPDVTWGGPEIRDPTPLTYVVSDRGALLLQILDEY